MFINHMFFSDNTLKQDGERFCAEDVYFGSKKLLIIHILKLIVACRHRYLSFMSGVFALILYFNFD